MLFNELLINEYFEHVDINTITDFNPIEINYRYKWYYSQKTNEYSTNYPVYKLLYIYEELINSVFENYDPKPLYKWLINSFEQLSDDHKKLFNKAFLEDLEYYNDKNNKYPIYHRPSVFLLDEKWMNDNGYKNVRRGVKSYIFHDSSKSIIQKYYKKLV